MVEAKNVSLSKSSVVMTIGQNKRIKLQGGGKATWTSQNKNIATVDSNGNIAAVSVEKTTIVAKVSGKN